VTKNDFFTLNNQCGIWLSVSLLNITRASLR